MQCKFYMLDVMPMGLTALLHTNKVAYFTFVPTELDAEGIEKQINDIVTTACRACDAGYDGWKLWVQRGIFKSVFSSSYK